MEDTKHSK